MNEAKGLKNIFGGFRGIRLIGIERLRPSRSI